MHECQSSQNLDSGFFTSTKDLCAQTHYYRPVKWFSAHSEAVCSQRISVLREESSGVFRRRSRIYPSKYGSLFRRYASRVLCKDRRSWFWCFAPIFFLPTLEIFYGTPLFTFR